eukprot:TRINITY_DN63175_c0_g1_i1.p1 TRINITY_DN63175_c0_g1~~TRINITY_DN63175_c0_g1_i1.p1  ORF type:complete len:574 (-),score=115.85 TRINITY_DN63175_c0_g1_i1:8-1729(-)
MRFCKWRSLRIRCALGSWLLALAQGSGRFGGASPGWQEQKRLTLDGHPLYRRTIRREELPELRRVVEAARRELPPPPAARQSSSPALEDDGEGRRPRIAFLIQGEEDVHDKEASMWSSSEQAAVFVLTFKTQRPDAIFFPRSLLAEGRNVLLSAAAFEELCRGRRFDYYVLLDADAEAEPPWPVALPRFQTFLQDWQPAVGLPVFGSFGQDKEEELQAADLVADARLSTSQGVPGADSSEEPAAIFHFDHIFIAVHTEAADHLLPYDTALDMDCAWTSQWILTLLATALYRRHVLVLPGFRVINPHHSKYPKDACIARMTEASGKLRGMVRPLESRSCIPDPISGAVMLPGGRRAAHFQYLPIRSPALRKGHGAARVNYTEASLSRVEPCDGEVFAESGRLPYYASWCRGCSVGVSFLVLQSMVAASPYSERNWNELGYWFFRIGAELEGPSGSRKSDSYWMAAICFAISRRLLQVRRQPLSSTVVRNLADISDMLFPGQGEQRAMVALDAALEAQWRHGGVGIQRGIAAALTSAETSAAGLQEPWLLSGPTIVQLVHFLITGINESDSGQSR